MSRRSKLLVVLAVVLIVALLVVRMAGGAPSCPVGLDAVEADEPVFVPAAELVPEGTVRDERRPVVEAVSGILGEIAAGRFFESGVAALVALGDHLGLAAGTSVRAVTLPGGELRWGWEHDGDSARGGIVGQDFVLLVGSDEPAVVSIDAVGGTAARLGVAAYSLDGGEPSWTFPDEGVATVAGHDPGTGTTYAVTMRRGPGDDPREDVAGVTALDSEGRATWQRRLGQGFWSGSLWGDVFVARGRSKPRPPRARGPAAARIRRGGGGRRPLPPSSPERGHLGVPAHGPGDPARQHGAGRAAAPARQHVVVRTPTALLVADRGR